MNIRKYVVKACSEDISINKIMKLIASTQKFWET